MKHEVWSFFKSLRQGLDKNDSFAISPMQEELLLGMSKKMRDLGIAHKLDGNRRMTEDSRWWPQDWDLKRSFSIACTEESRLKMIEDAMATRDWRRADTYGRWLFQEYIEDGKLRQALRHLQIMMEVYGKDDSLQKRLKEAKLNKLLLERAIQLSESSDYSSDDLKHAKEAMVEFILQHAQFDD